MCKKQAVPGIGGYTMVQQRLSSLSLLFTVLIMLNPTRTTREKGQRLGIEKGHPRFH